jgi:hypothetical protein
VLGKVDVEYIGVKQVFYSWGTQFMPEITQFLVDELKKRIRGKRRTWRSHNFHFVSYDLLPCALSKGGQRSFVIKHGIVVRRNRMEAGPAHVRRNFDILTCTSRIEDYYDEILSKQSGKEHRIRAERPWSRGTRGVVQIRIAAVDDVRAMFGEQLADHRPRNDMREIENAKPLQGPERGRFEGDRRASANLISSMGGAPLKTISRPSRVRWKPLTGVRTAPMSNCQPGRSRDLVEQQSGVAAIDLHRLTAEAAPLANRGDAAADGAH